MNVAVMIKNAEHMMDNLVRMGLMENELFDMAHIQPAHERYHVASAGEWPTPFYFGYIVPLVIRKRYM